MKKPTLALAAVLTLALAVSFTRAEPEDEIGDKSSEHRSGQIPKTEGIFQEWLDSQHVLGEGDTECVMCVGFGGGYFCGKSCDATGLTIRKPDGSTSSLCGRCVKGAWE